MTASIRDDAGVLSRNDIQSIAGRYPFDLRVLTSTSVANKRAFEEMVVREVNAQRPNAVVIAVDPVHRFVMVRYGKGVNIPADKWSTIGAAGNADFKSGNWTNGVLKIADSAASAKSVQINSTLVERSQPETRTPITTTTVVHNTPAPVYHNSNSNAGWWVLGSLVVMALVAAYFWRRSQKNSLRQKEEAQRLLAELNEEVVEKRTLNREVDDWQRRLEKSVVRAPTESLQTPTPVVSTPIPPARRYESPVRSRPTYVEPAPRYVPAPTYVAPVVTPQPVYVNQSSHTDGLLTGMMLGEMMHRDHHTHSTHVIEREVVREPEYRNEYRNDSGGTTSSWEDNTPATTNDDGGSFSTFEAPSPPSSRPTSTYTEPTYEAPSYNDSPSYDSGYSDSGSSNDGGGFRSDF